MPDMQVIGPRYTGSPKTIPERITCGDTDTNLIVSFSKLKIQPVNIAGRFNNHFKDQTHLGDVFANFLGIVLPKITSHTYSEICEGGSEGRVLHYHTVDEGHRKTVRQVLEAYNYPPHIIDQMFEGNNIVEFSATLGHVHAARIVCHKVGNVLQLLFFDTNHHIYMNEKYVKESMFYEECPTYLSGNCSYMPTDCFAFGYLNAELISESFGYTCSPG